MLTRKWDWNRRFRADKIGAKWNAEASSGAIEQVRD